MLVASFASNVHRVQQAIDVALETGRKVALVGRSLRKNVNIARNLGYIDVPEDILVKPADLAELAPRETMILCTGSQGEPMSALTRIAYRDHQNVEVEAGDTVIISAKPVPGNELRVHDTINRLDEGRARGPAPGDRARARVRARKRRGAADDPRAPAAAERHAGARRVPHADGARAGSPVDAGVPEDGSSSPRTARSSSSRDGRPGSSTSSTSASTFVDGLGVGDVRDVALRDRRHLSEDGVLIVVVTLGSERPAGRRGARGDRRGFAEPGPLFDEAREEVERTVERLLANDRSELKLLQEHIHDAVGQLVYDRTGRRPDDPPGRRRGLTPLRLRRLRVSGWGCPSWSTC